jgi:hypothetical protein
MGKLTSKSTLGLVILVVIVLLFPFETTVVPEWTIHVLDEHGNSVPRVSLRETWKHYSFESAGHEQDLSTNDAGDVVFPLRTAKASLLVRIVGTTLNTINPHGDTGPSASVYVLGPYKAASEEPYYLPGRPLIQRIVVQLPGESPIHR